MSILVDDNAVPRSYRDCLELQKHATSGTRGVASTRLAKAKPAMGMNSERPPNAPEPNHL